ncbi:MAG: GAF domain-containing protein, partial [Pseudomonadota bacterium]
MTVNAVQEVADLAWGGQHEEALARAAEALANSALAPVDRIRMHDLRVESLIALARLADAAAEADALQAVVKPHLDAIGRAIAADASVRVRIREGRFAHAMEVGRRAVEHARAASQSTLLARALRGLGEAQFRARSGDSGGAAAREALALAEVAGDASGVARAHWVLAGASLNVVKVDQARSHAEQAADFAQRAGDWLALGNARLLWSQTMPDLAANRQGLQEADRAFERAGYVERRVVARANLVNYFTGLGLLRRAHRETLAVAALAQRIGARGVLANQWGNLCGVLILMGDFEAAHEALRAAQAGIVDADLDTHRTFRLTLASELAMAEGDARAALTHLRALTPLVRSESQIDARTVSLGAIAAAHLALGETKEALRASTRGTQLHRRTGLVASSNSPLYDLWWQHHRALAANGRDEAAWGALVQAHALLMEQVRGVRDEGLRRNSLNKDRNIRVLLRGWLRESAARHLADDQRLAHLRWESHAGEPFRRLVDSGMRLNEQRSPAELHDFLIDEVTELSGADRVLLVLEPEAGESARRIAGSLLPLEEKQRPGAPEALLAAITPWLDEARRTRAVALRHGPEVAAAEDQRSCLVAPLVAGRELLGCVYADLDGAFGRFHDGDSQLIGLLAAQAALTLANLRAAEGLERQVETRTAEARTAQAQAEQRAAELAVINSIQQGIAGSLDFQGIVDLVGDKLCEVMHSRDVGIDWFDHETRVVKYIYAVEHGQRLQLPDMRNDSVERWANRVARRSPLVLNSLVEQAAAGATVVQGTDTALSVIMVPILSGDRALGQVLIENHEREHAFGESDVRLLQTIAGSLGVALQSALLFDQTQRLLKETEQRNAELAVINSIQQGMAGSLDFQGIVELVGDKLRQVLGSEDLSITWLNHEQRSSTWLYVLEHGKRLQLPDQVS